MPLAHLWMAPGVEVYKGRLVPEPAPKDVTVWLYYPPQVSAMPTLPMLGQPALFRLALASEHQAHYDLANTPPEGWRWTTDTHGGMRAERI